MSRLATCAAARVRVGLLCGLPPPSWQSKKEGSWAAKAGVESSQHSGAPLVLAAKVPAHLDSGNEHLPQAVQSGQDRARAGAGPAVAVDRRRRSPSGSSGGGR